MAIELDKDKEKELITAIKRFFLEELDQDIGELKAMQVLDFCLKEIGPTIYSQAIGDAEKFIQERVADLGDSVFVPDTGFFETR